jgi:cytochrome c peroxidase
MRKVMWPLLAAVALVGCGNPAPEPPLGGAKKPDVAEAAQFAPLPAVIEVASNPRTPEKVALGKMLYYDTRFSSDGAVSCYVCHPLHDYGTSHRAKGVGHDHLQGGRNEPTVFNAAGHLAQFWDGRAPDVEAQALGPVLNPVEMGMKDGAAVVEVIRAIPAYPGLFRQAFPGEKEPVTFENFGRAIAAFERGLTTPSRWDQYLDGEATAITAREKDGLRMFVSVGCAACHTGTYVGGSMYQKAGAVQPWPDQHDAGRFQVTSQPADRMIFKVPSLRNVEQTWPYFHDGSVARLDDAIRMMGRYQLGKELTDTQVTLIRGWLHALTGEIDRPYIDEPVLPPSPAGVKLQVVPLAVR